MNNISLKKAAIINAASKYITVISNLVFSAILARILTPEDYGIVAIVSVFTSFFWILSDMGIGSAVIQNKDLTQDETNDIFGFTLRVSVIITIIFITLSYPISWFYSNSVYTPVCIILSISVFFGTLNMVPSALLMKDKRFVLVGVRTIVINFVTYVLAILLALAGCKYYALVIQSVVASIFSFLWNYRNSGLKISFKTSNKSIVKIRDFSKYQFLFNIMNYWSRNLDNILTGKYMGGASLGYYDKAYKLMLYPMNNLTHVITPVLHPILSEHQNDKKYIYNQYQKVLNILSLLGVFISAFCFFAAEEIIRILFGDQWIYSIPCFRALSLSIWAQMVTSSTGAIFQSLGNTKLLLKTGALNSCISIVGIIIGVNMGNILSLSICVTVALNIHFITSFIVLIKKGLGYSYIGFLKHFLKDWIIFIILMLCGLLYYTLKTPMDVLYSLVFKGMVMGTIYIACLVITGQYKILLNLLGRKG